MRGPIAMALGVALAASAQTTHPSHQVPVVPAQLLERPATIRTGISQTHDLVTTRSPEAQQFYDQGLTYLHHFVWIEAARAFNQALRLDPGLALGYVGLSYAYDELNQAAEARRALQQARTLGAAATSHERGHITVRERQLAAVDAPGDLAKLAAYRQSIDEAIAEFPSDAELWLRRGVAESSDPADHGQGAPATASRYFERVLALVPDHFAAHHYLTHAYENSGRIEDALVHGRAYATLAPNVPHARHMYGHELRRVGHNQEALAEFEAANRLETAYFKAENVSPEYDWHYEHNLDLLATSYQYAGQTARAETFLKTAFGLPTANLVQAVNKRAWPAFLRARGRPEEALSAAQTLIAHPHPVVQAVGHIESGHARLLQRQFAEAAADANRALAAMESASTGAGLVAVAFENLQGEFYLRTGQQEKGRAMLEMAVKKARAAPGPDEWSQALFGLEWIARAAREVGDWDFAGRMARQMLEHDRSYAGTHYALALVAERNGDPKTAERERALAETLWNMADPDLPELFEIRTKSQGPTRRP